MDLKMPEECDTVYPHRKETGNRTDGFGCTVRVQLIKLGEDVSLTVSKEDTHLTIWKGLAATVEYKIRQITRNSHTCT